MIDNRQAWLEQLLAPEIEGGWSDHPGDNGGVTNRGVTLPTLSRWLGRKATEDDLRKVTRKDAEDIALGLYWSVMSCDLLPGGVDVYAADWAYNSGPTIAAKKLQELVATKVDGFVADKTVSACRAVDPGALLLRYHNSRMEFLENLDDWPTFGRGWAKRCRMMLDLSQKLVKPNPTLREMAKSTIVKGAAVGAAVSGTAVATAPAYDWGQLWDMLQRLLSKIPGLASGLPEALQSAEPGVRGALEAANQTAAMPGLAGHITAVVTLGTSLYTIWCRYRLYAKGLA